MIMMGGDKKKIASIIVSRLGKKPGDADAMKKQNADSYEKLASNPDKEPMDDGLAQAADEIISAISSKNPEMLASALKDFFSMCDGDESPEQEEPQE